MTIFHSSNGFWLNGTKYLADGRLLPYGWSLAFVKRRMAAHRRAAAEAESDHKAAYHTGVADQWEGKIRDFITKHWDENVRILDFYRSPP